MNVEALRQHWALVVASGLLVLVSIVILAVIYRRSRRSQLRRTLKALRVAERRRAAGRKSVATAERRLAKLEARAATVRPRTVDEAKGSLADARALLKIADDQVLVAANHVRRVIYREYPPASHDKLRSRYLPDDGPDERPFSF